MKYGVYLPNFGPNGDARYLATLARDAEKAGWDGFFVWDHIAGWGGLPIGDPWIGLAAVAMSTERIRFGPMVTPLPRRRPWKYARETATLDHLSNGRLIAGVGIGLGAEEWDDLGEETDAKKRGQMLDEALEVVAGLWSGEEFSHDGPYYHVKQTRFLPKPVQQPRIPVWVGGWWPKKAPIRRAARWDGAFILYDAMGPEEDRQIEEAGVYFQEQFQGIGTSFDVIYAGRPTPGEDPAQAAEIVAWYGEHGCVTWWLENCSPFRFEGGMSVEWPKEALHERILQGPPKA